VENIWIEEDELIGCWGKLNGQIKEDEMGRACSLYLEKRNAKG
jgi:hypothetical protein